MKPTPKRIKEELARLRKLIDTTDDVLVSRIAYSMEHAIEWATKNTVHWGHMDDWAIDSSWMGHREAEKARKS
jgi:hypothetical protein